MIGASLWIDAVISRRERAEFAIVCVKADFSKPLPASVCFNAPFGRFFQKVEYEGIASIFFKGGCTRHKVEGCLLYPPDRATPPVPAPKCPVVAKVQTHARSARAGNSQADDPSGKGIAPVDELPSTLPPDPLKDEHNYGPWLIA
ncbi:hypothetical protein KSP40_PGU017749 [Platanthera guangdongensis]|uniref:Uncharacterized protein n=1 Tax=Platanthera guangdongensis TaxID=2320717 RepID=A0ABR2LCM9_9ASPA